MGNPGLSIWSDKVFRIHMIERLDKSDNLECTFFPRQTSNGKVYYDVIEGPLKDAKADRVGSLPKHYDGTEIMDEVNSKLSTMRIYLSSNDGDRNIVIRWNRSKQRWSGFQVTRYGQERLFIIGADTLARLVIENESWRFPNPNETGYYSALDSSSAKHSDGTYDVAAILGHRKSGKTMKFYVRWEDFCTNDENTWEPEAHFVNEPLLAEYKQLYNLG